VHLSIKVGPKLSSLRSIWISIRSVEDMETFPVLPWGGAAKTLTARLNKNKTGTANFMNFSNSGVIDDKFRLFRHNFLANLY
jgi:hypothetical protein